MMKSYQTSLLIVGTFYGWHGMICMILKTLKKAAQKACPIPDSWIFYGCHGFYSIILESAIGLLLILSLGSGFFRSEKGGFMERIKFSSKAEYLLPKCLVSIGGLFLIYFWCFN